MVKCNVRLLQILWSPVRFPTRTTQFGCSYQWLARTLLACLAHHHCQMGAYPTLPYPYISFASLILVTHLYCKFVVDFLEVFERQPRLREDNALLAREYMDYKQKNNNYSFIVGKEKTGLVFLPATLRRFSSSIVHLVPILWGLTSSVRSADRKTSRL